VGAVKVERVIVLRGTGGQTMKKALADPVYSLPSGLILAELDNYSAKVYLPVNIPPHLSSQMK